MSATYDVMVIGSGPGGYIAAIRAAQLGFKTAIVEREHLGGICLNWGCIPTKALLYSTEIQRIIKQAAEYGLTFNQEVRVDIKSVVARSRFISKRLNKGVAFLMKKNKIDVIWGEARLLLRETHELEMTRVQVKQTDKPVFQPQHPIPTAVKGYGIYEAKHVLIATGCRPRLLSGMEPDGKLIWTYFEAMVPEDIPKSIVVVGSGAIGIEFASFYRDLGTEVTILEILPQILPTEDSEISKIVRQSLEKRGIKIFTNVKIIQVEKNMDSGTVAVNFADGVKKIIANRLISAIGVQGNIENMGLEDLGIHTKHGCIITDQWSRTNIKGIYAVGDVAGSPMLAHKAEEEGVVCIEKIANLTTVRPVDKKKIPGCIYCTPQVASVGLTEQKAREAKYDVHIGRCFFAGNGRAIALGEDMGVVKTIFDKKSGQLLGAHMVGAEVTELIHGFVIAMNLETTEQELIHSIFPHPTLSEMIKESVLDAYGRALNA